MLRIAPVLVLGVLAILATLGLSACADERPPMAGTADQPPPAAGQPPNAPLRQPGNRN